MPKDEWGVKRVCPSCATRFYDLQRDPMVCPVCGAEFDLESLTAKKSSPRPEKATETAPSKDAIADVDVDDADVVLDDDEDDDDVKIDDDLLEADDDDDDSVSLDDIADVGSDDDED